MGSDHEPDPTPSGEAASEERAIQPGAELDAVFPQVYETLRRIAHRHLRSERGGHTLGTTALVHEAYMELAKVDHIRWPSQPYVLAAASRAMRRILIDYAVAKRAQKRGGGIVLEPLDDAVAMAETRAEELLALDDALTRLSDLNDRWGRVVEYRFFGGMSVEETADALGTSPATVKRDWTIARAWLNRELADA